MPRGPQTEERLVAQIAKIDQKRKVLKKKLQVMRIRASAKRRKAMFSSLRKNEKEVMAVLKSSAPDFFKKMLSGDAPVKRRGRAKKTKG